MSLATQISDLATRIGTEFKAIRVLISGSGTGGVSGLETTATNLVGAINEVHDSVAGAAGINDATTSSSSTWSSTKISGQLATKADSSSLGTASTHAATDFDAAGTAAALISDGANDTTHVWSSSKSKSYADGLLDANNAMQYKGTIDCSTNPNYPAASAGWTYKVSVAGKIGGASGVNVEVGDTLYCLTDGSAAGTQAAVGANWDIVQSNIDGEVVGPASSTAGDFATFSGTTGKIVQDSGVSLDTDGAMAANSDARLASQKAVLTYLGANYYNKTSVGDPTTDFVAVFNTALT